MLKRSWVWLILWSLTAACDSPCEGCDIVASGGLEVAISTTRASTDKPQSWDVSVYCPNCLNGPDPGAQAVGLDSHTVIPLEFYLSTGAGEALVQGVTISGNPETSDYTCNDSGRVVDYDFSGPDSVLRVAAGETLQVAFNVTCESS
jgi:hypothetical protein